MPQNKQKNRKNNKRQGRSRPKGGAIAAVSVPSGPMSAALPVSLRTKLRYVQVGTLNAGAAGSYAYTVIRTNSLYDPDQTGVGSQPAGFAALSTLYASYRVIGAKVLFRVANDSGGTVNTTLFQSTSSLAPSSYVAASQQAFSKNFLLSDQSGGKNNISIRMNVKPWAVLGVTKERYMNDDQYAAIVTVNPTIASFVMLYISALTIAGVVQFNVEIVYDAVFFGRVNLL